MSREELNRRLREEQEKSAAKPKKAQKKSRKQTKLSEATKKQLPPQSPVRKQRDEELKKQRIEEEKARKEAEKRKKRRKRGNNIIYYILLSILVFIVFAILSVTILFNANKIVIEGETIYSDEEIIAASGLKGDENLVRLSTAGIPEKILEELVSLDTAEVIKEFPYTIKIKVTPAVPMVNFYYAGKNYVISHVGRVMQIDKDAADCMEVVGYQPGDNVVVGDYITAANPEQDELISLMSSSIADAGITGITKLDISDTLNITLTYEDRVRIMLGTTLQLTEKLKITKELLENHIGPTEKVSLDVSSVDKVVQRPLVSSTTTAVNYPEVSLDSPVSTAPTSEATTAPPEE